MLFPDPLSPIKPIFSPGFIDNDKLSKITLLIFFSKLNDKFLSQFCIIDFYRFIINVIFSKIKNRFLSKLNFLKLDHKIDNLDALHTPLKHGINL